MAPRTSRDSRAFLPIIPTSLFCSSTTGRHLCPSSSMSSTAWAMSSLLATTMGSMLIMSSTFLDFTSTMWGMALTMSRREINPTMRLL